MIAYLKLIRFPNLLIVGLTQYLIYFQLLIPSLQIICEQPSLGIYHFSLLVLITILLTANGYIINDLLDQKSDAINKPDKNLIASSIAERNVTWLYLFFTILGFLLAIILALSLHKQQWLFLYPAAQLLLFWYSYSFKKKPLIGNIVVALFCAGVAGIIFIAESAPLEQLSIQRPAIYYKFSFLLLWYMAFAFLGTLIREIVKDIEDIEGDLADGCATAPIVWGVATAKGIALGLSFLLISLLFYQLKVFSEYFNNLVFYYSIFSILLPFLFNSLLLIGARSNKLFHIVSQVLKFILLAGVMLIFFVKI